MTDMIDEILTKCFKIRFFSVNFCISLSNYLFSKRSSKALVFCPTGSLIAKNEFYSVGLIFSFDV